MYNIKQYNTFNNNLHPKINIINYDIVYEIFICYCYRSKNI